MYIYEEIFYEKPYNLLTKFVQTIKKNSVKPDMLLKCIKYLTLLFIRCSYYFLIIHFYS